jgi:hypothetical protein
VTIEIENGGAACAQDNGATESQTCNADACACRLGTSFAFRATGPCGIVTDGDVSEQDCTDETSATSDDVGGVIESGVTQNVDCSRWNADYHGSFHLSCNDGDITVDIENTCQLNYPCATEGDTCVPVIQMPSGEPFRIATAAIKDEFCGFVDTDMDGSNIFCGKCNVGTPFNQCAAQGKVSRDSSIKCINAASLEVPVVLEACAVLCDSTNANSGLCDSMTGMQIHSQQIKPPTETEPVDPTLCTLTPRRGNPNFREPELSRTWSPAIPEVLEACVANEHDDPPVDCSFKSNDPNSCSEGCNYVEYAPAVPERDGACSGGCTYVAYEPPYNISARRCTTAECCRPKTVREHCRSVLDGVAPSVDRRGQYIHECDAKVGRFCLARPHFRR